MPKIKRKRCKSCGVLPRRGGTTLIEKMKESIDNSAKNPGKYKVSVGPVSSPKKNRDWDTMPRPMDIPIAPKRPPKSSPFHPDNWDITYGSKGGLINDPKYKVSPGPYTPVTPYVPKSGPKKPSFNNLQGDMGYMLKDGQWYKNSFAGLNPVSESSVPASIKRQVSGGALSGLVSKRQKKALKREG